jgi:RNA polymerase sigma-70 factor (ECF subfamily)
LSELPFYLHALRGVSTYGERPGEDLASGAVDPETIDKARRGDPAALEDLLREVSPRLLRLARRLTADRDAAEDLVMEALYRGSVKIRKLRDAGAAMAWFRTILLNLWRSRLRRASPREVELEEAAHLAGPGTDPTALLASEELREACARAIPLLPPAQRAVLALALDEGLSTAEIAAALGTTCDRVKANLWHARRRLRKLLGGFIEEGPRP